MDYNSIYTEVSSVMEGFEGMLTMSSVFHYVGVAALILGITFACLKNKKIWHISTGIGGGLYAAGFVLSMVVTFSMLGQITQEVIIPSVYSEAPYYSDYNEPFSDDYTLYSEEYIVGDGWLVTMELNTDEGYIDLYSAYDDSWLCELDYGEYTNETVLGNGFYDFDDFIEISDYNGDGYTDIGIEMTDGSRIKYLYDVNFEYFFHESLF